MSAPLVLGRYEVYEAIGAGGMASVHLGRVRGDAGFSRTVAVKRLHARPADDHDTLVAMLMDEARLGARIRHPNVLSILDVVADAEIFLVMEYVHGEALDRLLRRPERIAMPAPLAAAIFADVLHGIHAAHEATSAAGE